ncbi:MAG: hypothetical protein ACREPQ_14375 [Rhodanobacter sp.]
MSNEVACAIGKTTEQRLAAALRQLLVLAQSEVARRGQMSSSVADDNASIEYAKSALRDFDAPPFWVSAMPVLSTLHIDQATSQQLADGMWGEQIDVVAYDEGFFGKVPDQECDLEDLPTCLLDIVAWCRGQGFDQWFRIDSVGDRVDDLPTYQW